MAESFLLSSHSFAFSDLLLHAFLRKPPSRFAGELESSNNLEGFLGLKYERFPFTGVRL